MIGIFCKKLSIRTCLYTNAFLISMIMAFSVPITAIFFYSHISSTLIAGSAIVFRLVGVFMSYIKQSKIAIRYISDNFYKLMIVIDACYILLSLIGESYPDIRFFCYNLIGIAGVKLMQVVNKDNIANCLHGTSIITFGAKCDTIGLLGGCLGSALSVVILEITSVNVTVCMLLEALVCMIAHWLQYYANYKIQSLGVIPMEKYTFHEVVNDLIMRRNNKNNVESDESIFDN